MELFIFIVLLVAVIYIAGRGKVGGSKDTPKDDQSVSGSQLTDDEIVTVILPTINNDGK